MWGFMICFHINMSMPWTRPHNVSNYMPLVDTFPGHVHDVADNIRSKT